MGTRSYRERWLATVAVSDLGATVKLTAYACGLVMGNKTGGDVRPGRDNLVQWTGLSLRTVDRAMNELQTAGFLVKVRRGRQGVNTLYRGVFPAGAGEPELAPPPPVVPEHTPEEVEHWRSKPKWERPGWAEDL